MLEYADGRRGRSFELLAYHTEVKREYACNRQGHDDLKYNRDGSLDINMQHTSPGRDKESDWLPSPAADRPGLTLRLYAPKQKVLGGEWSPPFVREVK